MDGWYDHLHDDIVLEFPFGASVGMPTRVEGKAAIKDQFATLFETYPKRQGAPRQATTRVYANDSVVVTNAYVIARYTDKKGNDSVHYIRVSRTVVKTGAEWKIVDQHVSRVPIP